MIDFVVTWVDDSDENWLKEKRKYDIVGDKTNANNDTRYRDWGLLKYWFRGVEKNCPWVNKIFFITYGHVPKWLNLNNPKLAIVKHEDYIPSKYLPTFNSNVIELHLNKIKQLSNQFVLFNDDMFIIDKVKEKDFFKNGKPVESALLDVLIKKVPEDIFPYSVMNNMGLINRHFNKRDVQKKYFFKFFNLKYGKSFFRNIE